MGPPDEDLIIREGLNCKVEIAMFWRQQGVMAPRMSAPRQCQNVGSGLPYFYIVDILQLKKDIFSSLFLLAKANKICYLLSRHGIVPKPQGEAYVQNFPSTLYGW
jgi:hypothetical protein